MSISGAAPNKSARKKYLRPKLSVPTNSARCTTKPSEVEAKSHPAERAARHLTTFSSLCVMQDTAAKSLPAVEDTQAWWSVRAPCFHQHSMSVAVEHTERGPNASDTWGPLRAHLVWLVCVDRELFTGEPVLFDHSAVLVLWCNSCGIPRETLLQQSRFGSATDHDLLLQTAMIPVFSHIQAANAAR